MNDRTVYVISDLHLGGEPGANGTRGFRITTRSDELARFLGGIIRSHPAGAAELVINGDFIDFLAEAHPAANRSPWLPFLHDADRARETAGTIFGRHPQVVAALAALIAAGHRVTFVLGNHDVELSFPAVRALLADLLGTEEGNRLRFICDGEAYVIDRVLIEHGNRYDGFNAVAFNSLRQLRSLQSRGLQEPKVEFPPPVGSELVARIVNPIKRDYPFVDLLKPETSAVVPLLLALSPKHRALIFELAPLLVRTQRLAPVRGAVLRNADYIAAGHRDEAGDQESWEEIDAVRDEVERRHDQAMASLHEVEALVDSELELEGKTEDASHALRDAGEIAAGARWSRAVGLAELLTSRNKRPLRQRLKALRCALAALQADRSWELHEEPASEYLAAAEHLARGNIAHIIFGHTHLAKHVTLKTGEGRTYLNTGTWADLARFPLRLLQADDDTLEAEIKIFLQMLSEPEAVAAVDRNKVRNWLRWEPFAAVFTVENGRTSPPELIDARTIIATAP